MRCCVSDRAKGGQDQQGAEDARDLATGHQQQAAEDLHPQRRTQGRDEDDGGRIRVKTRAKAQNIEGPYLPPPGADLTRAGWLAGKRGPGLDHGPGASRPTARASCLVGEACTGTAKGAPGKESKLAGGGAEGRGVDGKGSGAAAEAATSPTSTCDRRAATGVRLRRRPPQSQGDLADAWDGQVNDKSLGLITLNAPSRRMRRSHRKRGLF